VEYKNKKKALIYLLSENFGNIGPFLKPTEKIQKIVVFLRDQHSRLRWQRNAAVCRSGAVLFLKFSVRVSDD
jgi:hypothetical protein